MPAQICEEDVESLRLPKDWHSYIRCAVLNVIGIVRVAMLAGREALIKNGHAKDARIHQLESEVAMLREELRINGTRIQSVPPHRRPQYTGIERMAILQLRAMRGWNKSGKRLATSLFRTDTVGNWLLGPDDDSLVDTHTPVNRFPDFVRYAVQQIKLFCPTLGKVKIADTLARTGMREHQLSRLVHLDCQRPSRLSRCRHWSGCLIRPHILCASVHVEGRWTNSPSVPPTGNAE